MSDIVKRLREMAEADYYGRAQRHFVPPEECADEIEMLERERDALREALHSIVQWADAYPLTVFPEPNLKRAAIVLEEHGMTLDAISAHAMRHALEGVGKLARAALEAKP
jgi:hypothetical protein